MTLTAHAAARAAALTLTMSVVLGLTAAARAQDGPKDPAAPSGEPAKPEDAAPKASPEDAEKTAERMRDLYGRAAGDAPRVNAREADPQVKAAQIKKFDEWTEAVAALASAADVYSKQIGGAAPSARALFWGGYGKARHADVASPAEVAKAERVTAAKLLARCLEGLAPDADFRADAAFWLGRTQLFLVPTGGATSDQAVANLRVATVAFLKAGRGTDAGAAAKEALKHLTAAGNDTGARAFADAVGAAKADFGTFGPYVAQLVAKSATAVGAMLPDLPEAADADGKPIEWKKLRGAPLVLHFFAAGEITGRASQQRDVETTLRPLYDRLHPKGLGMIGVSMDRLIPKDEAAAILKRWDEDGTKELLQDGSKSAVQHFAEVQGIAWPWTWDAKWQANPLYDNPISVALGGVGLTAAHAVLVDGAGVIRWRGDAPFLGLAEAADKLIADAKR